MAKRKQLEVMLKEYEVQDLRKDRVLKMFVKEEHVRDFEVSTSFIKKVEFSCKIVDSATGQVYKNKVNEVVMGSEKNEA